MTAVATRFGWQWWHVPAPMVAAKGGTWRPYKKAAGLPDLILLHDDPPRMILAELKGDGGELSEEQREFLRLAHLVAEEATTEWQQGVTPAVQRLVGVYVWRPADRDGIERMLRSKVLL